MGAIRIRDDLLAAIEEQVASGAVESVEVFVEEALRAELSLHDALQDTDEPAPFASSQTQLAASLDASLADVDAKRIVPGEQVVAELRARAEQVRRARESIAAKA